MEVYLVLLSLTMSQLVCTGSTTTPACGRVRAPGGPSGRIVGGNTAGQGQFPWMAMLIQNGRHFCGGSIIDEWHILTAANCFDDVHTAFRGKDMTDDNATLMVFIETAGLEVIVGKHQYDTNRTYPTEQRVRVKAGVRHVSYLLASGKHANDIALLRLERALTFDDTVSSICLANETSPLPREGTVAGWGYTNGTATTSPTVLMMLKASVFSREDCLSFSNSMKPADKRKYSVDLEEHLADNVLCLVNTTSDGDEICYGDSGGPLFSLAEGGDYYQQWGVVSWSYGSCPALSNFPQVFTLVPAFLTWIQQAKLELVSPCANYSCYLGICQEWQQNVQCVCYNGTVSTNCTSCVHKMQGPEGTFSSFNYPESYLKNIECLWIIEAGPGMKVELYFWDFDLLNDVTCAHDYVQIYQGNLTAGQAAISGTLCGSGRPEMIRVVNTSLTIYFFRNVFYLGRGFQAAYRLSKATAADEASPPCGVVRTSPGPSARIINGRPAMEGQFPWMVMLTNKGNHLCGGTVIDPWHVVTAAHCLEDLPIKHFIHCESEAVCVYVQTPDVSGIEVIAGKQAYDHSQPYPGEQRIKVAVGRLHEEYKMAPGFVANDIAVLLLERPLVFNHNVSPICLPKPSSTVPQLCSVAGWGLTNGVLQTFPAELMTITTSAFSREDCMRLPDDGRYDLSGKVANNTMCLANVTYGGVHVCMGDSGGPVFCLAPGGASYQLMGVVSWVYGKCRAAPGVPAIMTFVPPFLSWLEDAKLVLGWVHGSDCARDPCDVGFCLSIDQEHTCVCLPEFSGPKCDKCGRELTGSQGGFTSFNYPEEYLNDMDCEWTIQALTGQTIDLLFLDMDIEDSPNCTLDYVEIRESNASGKSLGTLCGIQPQLHFTVSDKSLWIHFVSNIGFRGRGFKAIYLVTGKPQADNLPPCGVVRSPRGPSARIIGGSPAGEGQFPWMVMLLLRGSHFCGGTIIDPLHVVTAAHCFDMFETFFVLRRQKTDNDTYREYMDIKELAVIAGKHQYDASSDWEQERIAVAAIRHQQYEETAGKTSNDIAVIRLDRPLYFNDRVSSICLPTASSTLPPECTVAGWGYTHGVNETDPTELLMFTSSALSREDCLLLQTVMSPATGYDKDLRADLAEETMCIVNITHGGEDSCQGDSGGPAFCLEKGGQFYELMGVVSWGYKCDALPAVPGVYTFIPPYLPWVNQTIKDLASPCAFRPCGYGLCLAMEMDFDCVCPEGFSGSDCEKCVTVLTKPEGEFKSFNYPGLYPNSMDCQWFVKADRGMHVQILFHDFELEANCSLDFVEIRENGSEGTELERLCGSELPHAIRVWNTSLWVHFVSSKSVRHRGFHAEYRLTVCAPFFYGQNCSRSCGCNQNNTLYCNHVYGTCVCRKGWKGDTCSDDINECEVQKNLCTGVLEECTNTEGGYQCTCKDGAWLNNRLKKCVESVEIRFKLKIDEEIEFDDTNKSSESYLATLRDTRSALQFLMVTTAYGVLDVIVLNIRKGSLIVEGAVVLAKAGIVNATSFLAMAVFNRTSLGLHDFRNTSTILEIGGLQMTSNSTVCDAVRAMGVCNGSSDRCDSSAGWPRCRQEATSPITSTTTTMVMRLGDGGENKDHGTWKFVLVGVFCGTAILALVLGLAFFLWRRGLLADSRLPYIQSHSSSVPYNRHLDDREEANGRGTQAGDQTAAYENPSFSTTEI